MTPKRISAKILLADLRAEVDLHDFELPACVLVNRDSGISCEDQIHVAIVVVVACSHPLAEPQRRMKLLEVESIAEIQAQILASQLRE